ncbi:hypothetical protein ABIA38_002438 [Embleya sp. AB8]
MPTEATPPPRGPAPTRLRPDSPVTPTRLARDSPRRAERAAGASAGPVGRVVRLRSREVARATPTSAEPVRGDSGRACSGGGRGMDSLGRRSGRLPFGGARPGRGRLRTGRVPGGSGRARSGARPARGSVRSATWFASTRGSPPRGQATPSGSGAALGECVPGWPVPRSGCSASRVGRGGRAEHTPTPGGSAHPQRIPRAVSAAIRSAGQVACRCRAFVRATPSLIRCSVSPRWTGSTCLRGTVRCPSRA